MEIPTLQPVSDSYLIDVNFPGAPLGRRFKRSLVFRAPSPLHMFAIVGMLGSHGNHVARDPDYMEK